MTGAGVAVAAANETTPRFSFIASKVHREMSSESRKRSSYTFIFYHSFPVSDDGGGGGSGGGGSGGGGNGQDSCGKKYKEEVFLFSFSYACEPLLNECAYVDNDVTAHSVGRVSRHEKGT